MNLKTARIVSFVFSTSALVIAGFYFFGSNREAMKPFMYVGLGLILVSLVFRNLIRFKPDLFKDHQDNK
jgi:hypothetical protein